MLEPVPPTGSPDTQPRDPAHLPPGGGVSPSGYKVQGWLCLHCGKVGNYTFCPECSCEEWEHFVERVPVRPEEAAAYALGGKAAVLALFDS